ncbi:DUF4192 domain-containing protein [Actinoplanes solisilvae]|uniref:DUF4192 domain-containing protein n=1 Tax=Actinoplanes solisilvae TaxID=2486853 RepID=UPI000FD7ECFE|nr:DUF4192 domain-containing protein [Actinoplanes solisilvae]
MALAEGARRATLPGMNPECTIAVRSAADLIAVTPYLLSFHPSDSIVVIGTVGRIVTFVARHDLPPPGADGSEWIASLVARQGVEAAAVLGFGPATPVARSVEALAATLERRGLLVPEKLRITDGRWWMVGCADGRCCPPEGRPVPSPSNPVAAAAIFQGQVALPDRAALVKQIAAVEGEPRRLMAAATKEVCDRLCIPRGFLRDQAGFAVVRAVEERYAKSGSLPFDETACLGVMLAEPEVHDYALDRTADEPWRLSLWTEVTRRVEPVWVPGPATLLAYAAWRAGNGALARIALDRALLQDPGHRFAALLDRLLAAGISHSSVEDLNPPVGIVRGRSR